VKSHLKGHGALGDYFAGFLSGTIKMGDTPSVMYVLGKNPNDPSGDSWGGHFVRAWDRPFYQFHRPIYPTNVVEVFSIVEFTYPSRVNPNEKQQSTLIVDQQEFPGFLQSDHQWHFFYSPKEPKTWSYVIHSSDPSLDGQKGGFVSLLPTLEQKSKPSNRYANWWTDDPDPGLAEGIHQGAKTISKWRKDYLKDFALHTDRTK
jgi:hypothetical protein